MTIFQVECFLAVAEFLNFAKAAEKLHVSQPAITRQIRSLEDELGTKLFVRNTRMVRLTGDGRVFYGDAITMAAAARRSVQRFSKKDEEPILDMTIGCATPPHMELFADTLRELKEICPAVHPRLHILPEPHFFERLDQETIDAAIGFRVPDLKSSLQYRELLRIPLVCLFRDSLPLAHLELITMEDLAPHPMIVYNPGAAAPGLISRQLDWSKEKKPSQLYFCNTTEGALLLAQSGYGAVLLPDIGIPARDHLLKRPVADDTLLSFGIYYKTGQQKPQVKELVRLMRQAFHAPAGTDAQSRA